ncbi:MAG: hypothetical protein U0Q47_01030 [Mycobacterium sp.]
MQDDLDDFESPYFDWDNDRLFDEPTRRLIDRIANDPRFYKGSNNVEIVEELAPEKSEDEQKRLRRAAETVFDMTVLPVLEARALQVVARALAESDWEALRAWRDWRRQAPARSGNYRGPHTDLDPRVLEEFRWRSSAASDAYHRLQKEACAREESEVRLIVTGIPRRVRDLLVLANRNADRESLLEPWIEGASQSRRSWTAYYAQRVVREQDEDSVWDRYSAAAKILAGQGWNKKAIADGIGIGVKRIDGLLERTSGQDIADDDPLCDLVPDLRGRGEAWRDESLVRARKPKPFSRLSVDEKVALAEESTDPALLDRLAKQNSRRISRALVTRYLRGAVGENILRTIASTSPWMGWELIEAHEQRPLPQDIVQDIVIALADDDARVLLDCDDATARAAKSVGREDFEVVLAFRESDTEALERILTAGSDSESFWQLVDLLAEDPLADEMKDASSLLATALLHAAEQTDDVRAKVGSQRILGALVRRYRRRGDVGEDILKTILDTSPWTRVAMIEAHQQRPLPKDIALALAEDNPCVLLDCDDATAHAAKSLGRKDFEVVLAFRESDTDALERILTAGSDSESFGQLVDLAFKRPLTDAMIDSTSLPTALLRAAEQTDDVDFAAVLRLIACQSPEILTQYIDEAKTGGRTAMLPEHIVEVALGSYDPSRRNTGIVVEVLGSNTRKGVEAGARALWEAADLTVEHSHARKVVAERGSDAVSLESAGNIYLATADAIRCFPKSRTKEYTYVHMRLTPASDIQFGNMATKTSHGLPALGYRREMRKHPADPDGPDVEAIAWPIPIQPAIYSLDIGLRKSAGLIAVSGSRVAVVEER